MSSLSFRVGKGSGMCEVAQDRKELSPMHCPPTVTVSLLKKKKVTCGGKCLDDGDGTGGPDRVGRLGLHHALGCSEIHRDPGHHPGKISGLEERTKLKWSWPPFSAE